MINISDLSMKRQISDRSIMLACSGYFLGCPQSYLTRTRKAKIAIDDLAEYFF